MNLFGRFKRRSEKEDDLRAELEFHLSTEAEERQSAGIEAERARLAARRDLGNMAWYRRTYGRCGAGPSSNKSARTSATHCAP